ncbi:hypothetical protein ACH5RR_019139 [Cinchona calisaya]|uniref:RRM domain-containing protein n=1 Tax=Cinchona calisaya TaxID=153742 RepID=A0ABD2ZRK9_9GENT
MGRSYSCRLGKNDSRLFCGDLGNEVNDDVLFSRFPSFNMAKVVRDKRTGKTKGYGFVSFSNPSDLAAALKEMNTKGLHQDIILWFCLFAIFYVVSICILNL